LRRLVARYREQLANVPGIRLLNYQNDRTSSHHLCCILAEERDALVKKLLAGGVDVSVYYRRNDQYPMYEEEDLPNTDYFWGRVISLPLHLALTEEQVDHICLTIRRGW